MSIMMSVEYLAKMANDIGAFFEVMPDQEQAARDVAEHIGKFWEPRMVRALLQDVEDHGADELKPVVRNALAHLQEELQSS